VIIARPARVYRAQVAVLYVRPAVVLLAVVCPLLQVGQEAELPAVLGNEDDLAALFEHVGQ
jgi:hypothetical protein